MENYVVAVGIEKVQNFIYYSLTSHQQDSQSNSGTLSDVMTASSFISEELPADIEKISGKNKEDFLLNCSGKWIFDTKKEKETILTELDKLFEEYYKKFQGQLLLKYTCFEQKTETDENKLEAVLEASKKLKAAECLNGVLARERNRNILFNFVEVPSREADQDKSLARKKKDDQTQSVERESTSYKKFVKNMNKLFPQEIVNGVEQNDNHFRIAVIKADLDGMGDIFKGIRSYNPYKDVSRLLTEWISLKRLDDLADDETDFKLYPLYIAGDDIFFAVPVHQLLKGVQLCTNILIGLNKGIDEINTKYLSQLPHLSLSIGIELTFNREPIRYYYERVNRQLDDYAKKITLTNPFLSKQAVRHLKVSLNGTVFFYILEGDENKKVWNKNRNLRNWSRFIQDVRNLNGAIEKLKGSKCDDYQAHHFYYSLLEKITDCQINKNELTYSNAVLYHLLPQTWGVRSGKGTSLGKQQEAEFTLMEPLIRQLLIKEKENEKEQKLSFSDSEKERLESYLRMLVLFSDPRFCLKDVPMTERKQKNVTKNGKGILINKTITYLYQTSLKQEELREIFVCSEPYEPKGYTKKELPTVYRTLQIKSSMFHRIKKVMEASDEKVCKMIAAVNPDSSDVVKEKEDRNKEEGKAPPKLYFDQETLEKVMKDKKIWTTDYVDALLIFYQYQERAIQFQTNIKPKKSSFKTKSNAKKTKSKTKHSNIKDTRTK